MFLEIFLISLATIAIGLAFTFMGYQMFRVLIPLWGLFTGFTWGAQVVATGLNTGFLATLLGWTVGILVGLTFAVLAYFFYEVAVAVLAGQVGYWLVAGLFTGIGFQMGFVITLLSILGGLALAFVALYYRAPKGLLILLSALGGATATIAGLLLLFGVIPLSVLGTSLVGVVISQSFLWSVIWIAMVVFGMVIQSRMSKAVTEESSRTYGYPSYYMGAKGGKSAKKDRD